MTRSKISKALSQFIGIINLALAPLRQIAQLLEFVVAVLNCTRATVESVRQVSPDPILECIENLAAVINRLAEYVPPVPYLRAIAAILLVFIEYLDEIIRTLIAIDAKITQVNAMRVRAASLNDATLDLYADCAQQEVDQMRAQSLDGIQALMSIVGSLQQIVAILGSALEGDTSSEGVAELSSAIGGNATPGSTGLETIAGQVGVLRGILARLYRLLSTPIGDFVEPGPAPSFNFVNP